MDLLHHGEPARRALAACPANGTAPSSGMAGGADAPQRLRSFAFALLLLLATGGASRAASIAPWTIEDLIRAEEASELTLSRDGELLAWVHSGVDTFDGKEQRVTRIWLARLARGEHAPLTRGREHSSAPVFSPDGRHLAFLSDRELPKTSPGDDEPDPAPVQVWIAPLDGGEPYPLTRFDGSVRAVAWRDAHTVVALAPETATAITRARKRAKDDSLVVEEVASTPPVRLFAVSLEDRSIRRLTENEGWIDAMAVSPDGRHAVVREQRSLSWEFDQKVSPRTSLVDLESLQTTPLFEGPELVPTELAWTPEGDAFFFLAERSSHPEYRVATVRDLWRYELATGGEPVAVDLGWERGVSGGLVATSDGALVLVANGVTDLAVRLRRRGSGWQREELAGADVAHIDEWAVDREGRRVAYLRSTANTPPQVWTAELSGTALVGERRLTDLNPEYARRPRPRVEVLHVRGSGGDEVEALLHYPVDWHEGSPSPLVLDIHGGPLGRDRDHWEASWHDARLLFQQRGAFVLQVNYHGSEGYGLAWAESIGGGRYYELEIPDIEAAVDAVVSRGLADPRRLAVTGWSNGGILAVELITRSGRYRAAVIGAADVEWISDWANVDFGASFDNYYFGASPFADPELYVRKSPFFRLPTVSTPTLVLTGTADRNVPPHQSWNLYRALQQETETPVRLVLFPDEPHGLREVPHQRRKLVEETRWLDRHLFGREPGRTPAIPDESPLATLLDRAAARHTSEGLLGESRGGTLVPETVRLLGLEVGRFEVTRAQYRAFAPEIELAPGREELPMTGISFDDARRYVAWLAERTGRPYRLPTVAEARQLAERAGAAGNTLERWLGYAPNPDDRIAVAAALSRLDTNAPLLLPVGTFPGAGEPTVFDLDGNAAEWAEGEGGIGVAVGPSADRADDPRGQAPAAAAQYIGLRVVEDDVASK